MKWLLLLTLTGCAHMFSNKDYDKELRGYIGKPIDEIIQLKGIPDKTFEVSPTTKIYEWEKSAKSYTTSYQSGTAYTDQTTRKCVTDLTVIDGIVDKYTYRGSSCRPLVW